MSQDNLTLVRRWFEEVWNQNRIETIHELLNCESVCHTDDGPVQGPEEFKARRFLPFSNAFPDLRVTLEGMMAQGDEVVVPWSAVGRHSGDGLGFPATHETPIFRGMTWVQIHDGQLKEGWQVSNIPEVVRGLAAKAPG